MIALVAMFLTGAVAGGWTVWAMGTYAAVNSDSALSQGDWVPARLILEREGFAATSPPAATAPGKRHRASGSRHNRTIAATSGRRPTRPAAH